MCGLARLQVLLRRLEMLVVAYIYGILAIHGNLHLLAIHGNSCLPITCGDLQIWKLHPPATHAMGLRVYFVQIDVLVCTGSQAAMTQTMVVAKNTYSLL